MINQSDISISHLVNLPDHCLHSKLMKSISKSSVCEVVSVAADNETVVKMKF